MLTIGIETSCDETAVAVVRERKVLSNVVSSSVHLHARYGGVVPEIASRHHVEFIGHCLTKAVKNAGIAYKDLKLVSVTQGPGLMSSLLVGISMAKAISFARGIPIIGVNHLISHLWAIFLNDIKVKFPFIGFVVSGGHTNLIHVKSATALKPLGRTRDDACGESFDKVAKVLSLGYPGGPVIEKRARSGNPKAVRFPRSYMKGTLDFSFSGIKTAVSYHAKEKIKSKGSLRRSEVDDIAASFQDSVVDVLVSKAISACKMKKCSSLVVGGGVAANKRLRNRLIADAGAHNIKVYVPPIEYCMDNAAMVGCLGEELFKKGKSSRLDFQAFQHNPF